MKDVKVRGKKDTVTLNNQWIVPYNALLLLRYQCHLNVEIVHSVSAVKYLYKYLHKGQDRIVVEASNKSKNSDKTNQVRDEVTKYRNAKYISASQAAWQIYGFSLSEKYPPVQKLPLHDEQKQTVLFKGNESKELMKEHLKDAEKTMLTEFFTLCKKDSEAKDLTYPDVLKFYTWNNLTKEYSRRKRKMTGSYDFDEDNPGLSDTIGRIPVIPMNKYTKDLFFLRMLLHHVKGPTSFKALKQEEDTYQAAAIKLGLFEDDSTLFQTFDEAASITISNQKYDQLHQLFVTLLVETCPSEPKKLWDHCKNDMCGDQIKEHQRRTGILLPEPTNEMINKLLIKLDKLFKEQDKDMVQDYDLPPPENLPSGLSSIQKAINEEIVEEKDWEELERKALESYGKLNKDQKFFYNNIKDNIISNEHGLWFLDAPAGTGKTLTIKTLIDDLRSTGNIVLTTATTAIASTLLPNARTVHYRLKVPITLLPTSRLNFKDDSPTAEVVKLAKLLVIDEATMADRWMLEAIDRTLRDIRKDGKDKLFGGLPVLLSGDWRQCLPVISRGSRADVVYKTLKASEQIWKSPKIHYLKENMRVKNAALDDKEYAEYLMKVGEGDIETFPEIGPDMIQIDPQMKSRCTKLSEFCKSIFCNLKKIVNDGIKQRAIDPDWSEREVMDKAIICPKNTHVDKINFLLMQEIDGEEFVLKSADKVLNETEAIKFPQEWLNDQNPSGTPPHRLVLKRGAPVMLLRNLE